MELRPRKKVYRCPNSILPLAIGHSSSTIGSSITSYPSDFCLKKLPPGVYRERDFITEIVLSHYSQKSSSSSSPQEEDKLDPQTSGERKSGNLPTYICWNRINKGDTSGLPAAVLSRPAFIGMIKLKARSGFGWLAGWLTRNIILLPRQTDKQPGR